MRARRAPATILLALTAATLMSPPPTLGQGPRPVANYSRIVDGLYMGGWVESPPRGTTAVLNLTQWRDPYRAEVHAWEPIADAAPAPSLAWLREAADWVDAQRRAGRTTYVHCQAGVSRSGLVVTAYLMREYGWSREQALEFVRAGRPAANPNPAFMALLSRWEGELTPRRPGRSRR